MGFWRGHFVCKSLRVALEGSIPQSKMSFMLIMVISVEFLNYQKAGIKKERLRERERERENDLLKAFNLN
jgi:hypothetical protein